MSEKAKTPEVRFKGFTDPWEQRKLGDEFKFLKNNTLSRAELSESEGVVRNIHYGDVLIKFGSILDVANSEIPRIANESMARDLACDHLCEGDVVIADTAEDEAAGKCTELRGLGGKEIVGGLHTMPLRPIENYAPGFLGYYLNSDAYHVQLKPLMQGIKVISISRSALAETQMIVPSFDEQRFIGAYFSTLDNLITLHQRKYDKLVQTKKAMLDKMFPKPGESVPEIRFKGFTDPWEQRKFGELYRLVSEKNDLTFGRESIISVANMYFNANVNVTDEQYLRTYNVMRLGDIAFEGHSNNEFSHGRFVENYIGDGIVSHIFTVLRPRVPFDVNYWRYAINNEKLMQLPLVRSTKASTMMHDLVPSDFLKEAIPTPTIAEQKEIGAFLVGLDNLITLHQRKLELLRNIKKAMLDKMFV